MTSMVMRLGCIRAWISSSSSNVSFLNSCIIGIEGYGGFFSIIGKRRGTDRFGCRKGENVSVNVIMWRVCMWLKGD